MSEWDGRERREGMKEVAKSLEEIKLQLAEMKPSLYLIEKHNKTLYGNGQEGLTTKVDHIKGIRSDLDAHGKRDLWIQGLILAAILGSKLIK